MPDHCHAPTRPARLAQILILAWACLVWCVAPAQAGEPAWQALRPGLDLGFIMVDASVRAGSPRLAVLRVDPERFRFRILAAPEGQDGYSAAEWRKRNRALAVFNAGQFTVERAYLGLLVQDGKPRGNLVSHLEALFLAEPDDPLLPRARVLDLQYTAFEAKGSPYRQAAQSLMLLDRFGQIRVRRSQKVAHRTLVAEDGQGRIWVMVSEGKHTLHDLARVVSESNLGLREVMCMDGGAEAQLDLQVGDFSYQQAGGPSESPDLPLPWPSANLLAAVAIFPR